MSSQADFEKTVLETYPRLGPRAARWLVYVENGLPLLNTPMNDEQIDALIPLDDLTKCHPLEKFFGFSSLLFYPLAA
jgi:hypothetical protein